MHSARRGLGSDVAGSRPYLPGDDVDAIDWAASARLSSARGTDEFVVRERFAEEAPRVVIVCDRRPGMALCPPELPWLSKPRVVTLAARMIAASAAAARGLVGYLDHAEGRPFWKPPVSQAAFDQLEDHLAWPAYRAPEDALARAFAHLDDVARSVPAGSFVFVLTDFLAPPPEAVWVRALERRWDAVPVIVQDPTWEQSFPDVGGISVPLVDVGTGRRATVRLSRREAAHLRRAHEERLAGAVEGLLRLGLDPVLLGSEGTDDVLAAFLGWAEERASRREDVWRAG